MALLCISSSNASLAEKPPNVILIVTDNQTESLVGAYGNRDIKTPNIDSLAEKGMRFDRAYAVSGVCSPTRATLLTGLIPSQHGVHNGLPSVVGMDGWAAIEEFRSLPQTLSEAGYNTALVGKYHLGVPEKPQIGFNYWVTFPSGHTTSFYDVQVIDNDKTYRLKGEHLTDFWTRRAVDFIDQQKNDKPFFLYLAYNGPYNLPPVVTREPVNRYVEYYTAHLPSFPQEPVHSYLRRLAINTSTVEAVEKEQAEMKDWGVDDAESIGKHGAKPELSFAWGAIDALNNKMAMVNLASEISMVDDGVGSVMEALKERGFEDNTIIIFTSDQGSAYGQHGLWGNSSWASPTPVYKEHMQVPLIVYSPAHTNWGESTSMIINEFDIFPTILDLIEMKDKKIENSPGKSFADTIRGKRQDWDNTAYFEYISTRVIVKPDWKYIKRMFGEEAELYGLKLDPNENNNLIYNPEYAEIIKSLNAEMTTFFDRYVDKKYDPWQGGTGKAILMYSDENGDFIENFPGWEKPIVEKKPRFSDLRQ